MVANRNQINTAITQERHGEVAWIEPIRHQYVASGQTVHHAAEQATFARTFSDFTVEGEIHDSAGGERDQSHGAQDREAQARNAGRVLRVCQLILWRILHREAGSID